MNSKIHRRLDLLDSKARKNRIKGMRGGETSAEINITPLADVVLVLLIIFMVVLKKIDAVVELPKAFDPQVVGGAENPLDVFVKLNGIVVINDKEVLSDKVTSILETEIQKNPFRKVHLSADRLIEFKEIRKMLESFREAGVPSADLMSEPFKDLGN